MTAKVIERTSGANYVTLLLFLLTVSAKDIAIDAGNSLDMWLRAADCSPMDPRPEGNYYVMYHLDHQ